MNIENHRKLASIESKGTSSNEIVSSIVEQMKKLEIKFDNVLDIGCGTGDLLLKIKGNYPNANLFGIDYTNFSDLEKLGFTFKQIDCNENFSLELSDLGPFDLITCSEVIEHIENGRHFLRQIEKLLKPGGKLILTTPNTESLTSILSFIFKGYHSAFGPKEYPAHINSFSVYELRNIVNETNKLKLERIVFIPNGRIPGVSLKWSDFFPFIRPFNNKRFSDNYLAIISKDPQ